VLTLYAPLRPDLQHHATGIISVFPGLIVANMGGSCANTGGFSLVFVSYGQSVGLQDVSRTMRYSDD
jgi:hypothetical protein